ncbi:MAG: RDD family protein [Rhodoglobus sp.]
MAEHPHPAPPFGVRILALLIDYGLILAWMVVLALVAFGGYLATGSLFDWLTLGVLGAELLGFVLLVVPVGVYLYLAEISARQATVGKRVMLLRVVRASDLGRSSHARILVRTVIKLLPWEFAHFFVWHVFAVVLAGRRDFPAWVMVGIVIANVLPLVYLGVVAFQRDRRGPHDLVAGTRVVSDRAIETAPVVEVAR